MEKKELFDLVEKAIAGDAAAFEELYTLNAKIILFHTSKLIDDRADTEDVAQEIVLQMLRSISGLKSPYAFYSWMYRIITNICYAYNTKHRPKKREADVDAYADELISTDPDGMPDVSLSRTELDSAIIEAVNKLPESQRLALFMYYYEQMSYKEIAAALKIKAGTVGTNIMKAKKTLKSTIEREQIVSEEDLEMLRGVAIAPALTHAFDAEISGISEAQTEHFVQKCGSRITEYLRQPGGGNAAKKTASSGNYIALGIGAAVLIITIVFVFASLKAGAPPVIPAAPSAAPETAGEVYKPNAEIVLTSGSGQPGQINPIEAKLIVGDGEAAGWRIIDGAGNVTASGEGTAFSKELKELPPGSYRIEWSVKNDKGGSARVIREIEISAP
jgi:RNA polymerase sigma-70 factor (ECF subfamily)